MSSQSRQEDEAIDSETVALVTALVDPASRASASASLAKRLGGDSIFIFIKDRELHNLLPAPGFSQTLPVGRAWRSFLEKCSANGTHEGDLPYPTADIACRATGITGVDGSVLVLLGGNSADAEINQVRKLVPLVAAALEGEQQAAIAKSHAWLAQKREQQAQTLVKTLDTARRDLQNALHLRDNFLSIASHELKTPLTAILGYLQIMQRRNARDEHLNSRDVDTVNIIHSQARRLQRLTEALFDVAHIQTGNFNMEPRPLDMCLVVKRLVDDARLIFKARTIELECLADSLMVEGDELRLEQMTHNLIDNAVKYSPAGSKVKVRLEPVGEQVQISVSDEGIGIPADATRSIFDRFYRASNINPQNISGMGIGLHLVKQIVLQHEGVVDVASTQGHGATFTVSLPRYHGATAPAPASGGIRK